MNASAALLQALLEGEGYGLDLIERVRLRTRGAIRLLHGSVYPALRALEREGLLRSFSGESARETGGRPRRYYELTAKGRRLAHSQERAVSGLYRLVPDTSA